jgi:hypothetical protein
VARLPDARRGDIHDPGIESTFMKTTMRTWKCLAIGVGVVVLVFCAMRAWGKYDFCQGWSNHYAARAKEFRSEAANPTLGRDEAKKYLVAADIHDLISQKYAVAASRPWRPYPSYPLVTAGERSIIEGRY